MSMATTTTTAKQATQNRIIDSHLHVWANHQEAAESFPYAAGQDPPESLQNRACISALIQQMDQSGVDGALIVQPINHKFDHSYVIHAIQSHPDRFKGMLLFDPTIDSPDRAIQQLEDLANKGFVGVRFNPYLWPKLLPNSGDDNNNNNASSVSSSGGETWMPMSSSASAVALYRRCAELNMAVGIMCFQGLQLHLDDILTLIRYSPETILILDHFGFCSFTAQGNEAFQQLLSLAAYPNVFVKISALFRLQDEFPYHRVKNERLEPLLSAFGAERLMFGTDFPFVLLEPGGYGGTIELLRSWISNDKDWAAVMGGNAEKIFGTWGCRKRTEQIS